MKKVKTVLSRYANLPNPGLNSFLDRTERGQPDDFRTPFWGKADRSKVLSDWTKVVDRAAVDSQMKGLYEVEMEQKKKVGPYSIIRPFREREDDVVAYYEGVNRPSRPLDRRAMKAMKAHLRKGSLSLSSYKSVAETMKLSTNSGLPYFSKRRTVLNKTLRDIAEGNDYEYAAIMGARSQPGGPKAEDVKNRVIWMFPMELNMREARWYTPMIKAWQTDMTYPALVNLREVEKQVTELFDTKGDDPVVVTDFDKFDQSINPDLQEAAEELTKYQFNRKDHDFISQYFRHKYEIPLVCTEDVTYYGPHGMASGSTGTNPDENLIHGTLQQEAAIMRGQKLNSASTVLGDDGILSYPGINVQDVIDTYTSHGLVMNPDKQYVSNDSTYFLQRYYHKDYRDGEGIMLGVYSTFRALGRLLGQERFYDPETWGPKMTILRAWSIIENTANSPLFEEFVDFVIKGDKYRLGLDIPGFFENLDTFVEEARDLIPDLFGFTQGIEYEGKPLGIRSWRIYQYLTRKYRDKGAAKHDKTAKKS